MRSSTTPSDEALAGFTATTIKSSFARTVAFAFIRTTGPRHPRLAMNQQEQKSTVEVVHHDPARRRQVRRRRHTRWSGRPAWCWHHLGRQTHCSRRARRRGASGRVSVWACQLRKRPSRPAPLKKGEASDETGTTITFWPSKETFETVRVRFRRRCGPGSSRWHSSTKGSAHHRHRRARKEEDVTESYMYERGLEDYVEYLNQGEAQTNWCTPRSSPSSRRTPSARFSARWVAMAVDQRLHRERSHTYANTHQQLTRVGNARRGIPARH